MFKWGTAYPTPTIATPTIPLASPISPLVDPLSPLYPLWQPLLSPIVQPIPSPIPLGNIWQPMTVEVFTDNDILSTNGYNSPAAQAELATYQTLPSVMKLFAQERPTLVYIENITGLKVNS